MKPKKPPISVIEGFCTGRIEACVKHFGNPQSCFSHELSGISELSSGVPAETEFPFRACSLRGTLVLPTYRVKRAESIYPAGTVRG